MLHVSVCLYVAIGLPRAFTVPHPGRHVQAVPEVASTSFDRQDGKMLVLAGKCEGTAASTYQSAQTFEPPAPAIQQQEGIHMRLHLQKCRSVWRHSRCPRPWYDNGQPRWLSARRQSASRTPSLGLQAVDCMCAVVARTTAHGHDAKALHRVVLPGRGDCPSSLASPLF